MDLFDLQYADCMDELQYELYMDELYEEEAFSMDETPETTEAMVEEMAADPEPEPEPAPLQDALEAHCEQIIDRYYDRAESNIHFDTLELRAKRVVWLDCKAKSINGNYYYLQGIADSINKDGHQIRTRLTLEHATCNCDDSKYRPLSICKHRAALAARWVAQRHQQKQAS